MEKYYSTLTAIFMLLAVAAVVLYFAIPHDHTWFYITGGAAVVLRLVQYIWRLLHPQKKKRRNRGYRDIEED